MARARIKTGLDEMVAELKRVIPGFDQYAEYRSPRKDEYYIPSQDGSNVEIIRARHDHSRSKCLVLTPL